MTIPKTYLKFIVLPVENVFWLSEDDIIPTNTIKRGIVFIYARWSVGSQVSFRLLNQIIAELGSAKKELQLYLADTDHPGTKEFMRSLPFSPAGRGETVWVAKGAIVDKLPTCGHQNSDPVRQLLSALLGAL